MHFRRIGIPTLIATALIILLGVLALSSNFDVVLSQSVASTAEIRVKNGENYEVNRIRFRRIEYLGDCPGIEFRGDTGRSQFTSSTTPPAPGRRVIIRNVTEGMDNEPYPYTDRKYDEGQYSESFLFGFDTRHRVRTFSVKEGANRFTYEIREKDNVIESGSFTAEVFFRNQERNTKRVCQFVERCNGIPASEIPLNSRHTPRSRLCNWEKECRCLVK